MILIRFENFYGLIIAKSIQGLACSALTITPMMLIIKNIENEEKKIKALGYTIISLMIGLLAGNCAIGMITTYLNWTCCFIFLIPFIIVTLIFLLSLPKEEVDKDSEIDYLGAVTWLFSVIFCVYGITHFSSIYGWISLGIGVIVLSVFINHELKTSNALYDFRLLKNKNYAIDNYVALVISLTAFALPYFYGLYFQYYRLCTPSQAGLLVFMYGLFYILSNLIITKVYNHVEIKRLYKVSMSIQPLIVLILIFSNNL